MCTHMKIGCFFLSPMRHSFFATYPALILTVFESNDITWCAQAYTGEKFLNFCAGVFQVQKTTHTHNRFTALLEFVRDHPGEQVPER